VPEQVRGRDDKPRRLILCTTESYNKADISRRTRRPASPVYMSSFIKVPTLKVTVPYVLFVVVYGLLSMFGEEVLLVKYG